MIPIPVFYFVSGIITFLGGIAWCVISIIIGIKNTGLSFDVAINFSMGFLMIVLSVVNVLVFKRHNGFPLLLKLLTIILLVFVLALIPMMMPLFQ